MTAPLTTQAGDYGEVDAWVAATRTNPRIWLVDTIRHAINSTLCLTGAGLVLAPWRDAAAFATTWMAIYVALSVVQGMWRFGGRQ